MGGWFPPQIWERNAGIQESPSPTGTSGVQEGAESQVALLAAALGAGFSQDLPGARRSQPTSGPAQENWCH